MIEENTITIEKPNEDTTEVIEDKQTIKSDYEDMQPGDLIKLLQNRDSRLHQVNEESKSRKLKLREAEKIQEELKTNALKEQEKYKELYDDLLSKTANYEELETFRQSTVSQWEEKANELKAKLTKDELEDYSLIEDSLDISKKIKYLEKKANKQTENINIDSTRSTRVDNTEMPKTFKELIALGTEKVKLIKEKNPTLYNSLVGK